jgi:hypothetical protein
MLSIKLKLLAFFLFCSCTIHQDVYIDKDQVDEIALINERNDDRYPKKMVFNDQYSISPIIDEINKLRPTDEVGVKSNNGSLYLDIKFKDKSIMHYIIVYTVYDGIVIMGQDRSFLKAYSKYYKNDKLELILYYFLNHNKN